MGAFSFPYQTTKVTYQELEKHSSLFPFGPTKRKKKLHSLENCIFSIVTWVFQKSVHHTGEMWFVGLRMHRILCREIEVGINGFPGGHFMYWHY